MPYIKVEERIDVSPVSRKPPRNAGELNFQISALIDDYLLSHGVSYEHLNAVIGVLECAKLEAYRRIAVPYEDAKKAENGDVYVSVVLGDRS